MSPDFNTAATRAAETIIKYGIKKAPVVPLQILEQMDNVVITSFTEMCDSSGIRPCDLKPLFGKSQDAVTSVHMKNGTTRYVIAYNSLLPFAMVQYALAREMGHIVLRHGGNSEKGHAEAICFAHHLLCPRPLIHAVQATGMRLTTDVLAKLTGIFDQCLTCMRRTPGTAVPAATNRFLRGQIMPFVLNFFEYYSTVLPADGSAIADLGTFMDLYEE